MQCSMDLRESLAEPGRREKVIDDCCALVEEEVSKKKGLSGVVIKTGYKAVKGIKPGFLRGVVSSLLDDWIAALEPIWLQGKASGGSPAPHLESHRPEVAEALLSVTDKKSQSSKSSLVRGTYNKLRPSAKEHVEEAVPGLVAVLVRNGLG